jgi:hypothetical protein
LSAILSAGDTAANEAIRAAIVEAQKGRAAGLYAAVKVQHTCSSAGQVS